MTSLSEFHQAFEALAEELYDHEATHGSTWRTQSPLFHLLHARDHLAFAVRLIEEHAPLDVIAGHVRHGQTRAVMAAQRFIETQEPTS